MLCTAIFSTEQWVRERKSNTAMINDQRALVKREISTAFLLMD
jgi:hypothetical protein